MLGFSCSNEKVTVKLCCNVVQVVVLGLCNSLPVCPLECVSNDEVIPLGVSSSTMFCTSPSVPLVPLVHRTYASCFFLFCTKPYAQ